VVVVPLLVAQLLSDTVNASNARIIPTPRIFDLRKLCLLI